MYETAWVKVWMRGGGLITQESSFSRCRCTAFTLAAAAAAGPPAAPAAPCCCANLLQTMGDCLLRDISTMPGLLLMLPLHLPLVLSLPMLLCTTPADA